MRNDIATTTLEGDRVERDAKGRIVKGGLNPGGLTIRQARLKRQLEALTPLAIARLGQLVASENETVALGAVKEILDRNIGRARQQVSVDVSVEHTHVMHLEALKRLADRTRGTISGYNGAQPIDNAASSTLLLEGYTTSEASDQGVIDAVAHALAEPIEAVPTPAAETPQGADHPGRGRADATPPPATRKNATEPARPTRPKKATPR